MAGVVALWPLASCVIMLLSIADALAQTFAQNMLAFHIDH